MMVHTFSALGQYLAADVNSGAVHVLDRLTYDLLNLLDGPIGEGRGVPPELLEKLPVEDRQEDIIEALQLKTAIASLNERDRKVIVLRYFRDMTQSEVANMLGVSQVQVSRIENRIMESFRKDLTG